MADTAFDDYWKSVLTEVAALADEQPSPAELSIRSNEVSTAHGVRIRTTGDAMLFGYYCVPKGDGPFPGLLMTPGYGSVVGVPPFGRRQRFAVLALCARGQRLSDQEHRGAYPGLLTDRLEDPTGYPFRGIVADCLRGYDFLAARSEIDHGRIAVASGNNLGDLGLIVASLRPGTRAVLVNSPMMFRDTINRLNYVRDYPLEEFNDYLRDRPHAASSVTATLSLFDPLRFAPRIRADVLMSVSASELAHVTPITQSLPTSNHEVFQKSGEGHVDHEYEETWLAQAVA